MEVYMAKKVVSKAASTKKKVARVISIAPKTVPSKTNRAAESLAAAGLVDDEIARITASISVLPIDVELVGRARAFVTANLSGWNHAAWTEFIGELRESGYAVDSNRAESIVGVIVETIRATRQADLRLAKAA